MVKKIYFWNSSMQSFEEDHKFSNKNDHLPPWRKIRFFFTICTWPNGPVRAKILPRFQFEGKIDVWISQVRCVNTVHHLFFLLCSTGSGGHMILTRLLCCEAEQCRIELIKQIDVLEPHNKSCPNPSHWNGSSVWHTRHTLH